MRTLSLALLVMVVAVPAGAQAPDVRPPDGGRNQIVATGTGRLEVAPDQATLTMGAQVQRPTAAEALAEAGRVAAQVRAGWQQLGIRTEAMRTAILDVQPVFGQSRDGAPPRMTGYQATALLALTVDQLALLGRAIDAGMTAGANVLHGLTFGVRDASRARRDALAAAVRDARERAEAMAQAAGLRIRGVERIVEAEAVVVTREVRLRAAAAPAVPVEPGLVTVTAQVTVVFSY
ncbi:MAG: SIMPL domain-containing protein [Armatimonadota bacterium]|nr:SIMPL domain-containing protein [Armatimonadota bacterium]